MTGFVVRRTEDVLIEKKDNLFRKLQTDFLVSRGKLNELDKMLLDRANGKTLTQFCAMHLGGVDRDTKDYNAMARRLVDHVQIDGARREDAILLVQRYLACFASFVL